MYFGSGVVPILNGQGQKSHDERCIWAFIMKNGTLNMEVLFCLSVISLLCRCPLVRN
jgi:hypothetical protein